MIQYIIDRGVDLKCQDIYGWRTIDYICRYSTPEMIQYIIDKKIDLKCQTNDRLNAFDIIKQKMNEGA